MTLSLLPLWTRSPALVSALPFAHWRQASKQIRRSTCTTLVYADALCSTLAFPPPVGQPGSSPPSFSSSRHSLTLFPSPPSPPVASSFSSFSEFFGSASNLDEDATFFFALSVTITSAEIQTLAGFSPTEPLRFAEENTSLYDLTIIFTVSFLYCIDCLYFSFLWYLRLTSTNDCSFRSRVSYCLSAMTSTSTSTSTPICGFAPISGLLPRAQAVLHRELLLVHVLLAQVHALLRCHF